MKMKLLTVDVDVQQYLPVAHTSSHSIHLPVDEDLLLYVYINIPIWHSVRYTCAGKITSPENDFDVEFH